MKGFSALFLLSVVACSSSSGSPGAAKGPCDALLEAFCSRYASCFPDAGTGAASRCDSAGESAAGCASATSVTNGYDSCLSDVNGSSCSTLFPSGPGTTSLPTTCDGVVK
jgi:hypothetical protein